MHLLLVALAIAILTYLLISKLFGIFRAMRSPPQEIPGPCHANYGPICRLGPRHVWVSDKESLKQILSTIDLPKVAMYAEISRDRMSPGLFGEIASTAGRVQTDLMDDLHKAALDIMGESSFSKGFGQVKLNEVSSDRQMDETWKSISRAIFDGLADRYKYVFIKRFLRRIGFNVEFDWPKEMIMAIDSVIRQSSDEKKNSPDLLQHLIENGKRPDNEQTMNSRDILDQMSEILLAGSETTSGTIACLFLELARNPRVRAKLLASLPTISHDDVDDIIVSKTVRDSADYQYLEACIKENLRLHPIASEMGRRTGDQWFNLMGYDLPPHTVVSASYRDLHRNEDYWPDALSFIPEIWLPDEERGDYPAAEHVVATPYLDRSHADFVL
ncbi:cytochrome P450, family 3, subfamily A [Fusarium agapanthi]|uniref:Cytochrome P450, family 3, subfamily A n=1 Tax=Fusarium agapanthi TaxID=1803897 RepID=A0A9P5BFP5_9HYPO|nr:cytochrome P450, family 3, subfamily A [Fusarium agapanthi]